MNQRLFQIIDANLNRTREGLRVCEDIARFTITDKTVTRSLKSIRHAATRALLDSEKLSLGQLLRARDTKKDTLKFFDFEKHGKSSIANIFMSNIERVKESLRVLEECSKVIDEGISRKYRSMRFNTYDIEKKVIEKIRTVSGNR
jgi:thiamine-phosphate pyrophosphorylase